MMVQESLYPMSEIRLEDTRSEPYKASFNEFVLAAVDESLSSIGQTAKQEISFHLKEHHGISMEEIPSRLRDFAEALEESYSLGAKLIEIKIVKALYEKTGPFLYFPHGDDLSFASYVEMLRYFV